MVRNYFNEALRLQFTDIDLTFGQYKLNRELLALTDLQVDPLLGPFIDSRQVSARLKLQPGTYVIVPCTYGPDEEGDFLLRVLAEVPAPIKRLQ